MSRIFKRKIITTVILAVVVVLCLISIFCFSSQDSIQTNDLSRKFTRKICELIFQNFSYLEIGIQNTMVYEMNLFIRKLAHFSIYFFMSMFIYAELVLWIKKYFISGIISVLSCAVYAAVDEFHQSLVPGRTPLVKDVFIDSAGALMGVIFCFLIISVVFFIKNHPEK